MKQQKRRGPSRLISALLAMAMVLSMTPFAWAADETVTDFAGLKNAITSATAGDTITLGADITMTEKLTINKNITIVGGDYTITGVSNDVSVYFEISGGVLTISDATLTGFGDTAATSTGTGVFKIPAEADASTSGIVATGLTVEKFNRAAFDVRQGSFTIEDCTINCDNGQTDMLTKGVVAGYDDNSSVTGTITGGQINGADSDFATEDGSGWTASGIEVSVGASVVVEGVSIESMKGGISVARNYGPSNGTASVTVKDCTITAYDFALRIFESNSSFPTPKGTAQLTVESGTYKGDVRISKTGDTTGGNTSNSTITITGGTFKSTDGSSNEDVERFVKDGMTQDPTTGAVGIDSSTAVAQIGSVGYDDLAEALAAANSGDTVELLQNVTLTTPTSGSAPNIDAGVTLEVPENITLEVQTAALTNSAGSTLNVEGTLNLASMYAMDMANLDGDITLNPSATFTYGTYNIQTPADATIPGYMTLSSGTSTLNFGNVDSSGATVNGYINLTLNNGGVATVNEGQSIIALLPVNGSARVPFHITVESGASMIVPENATLSLPSLSGNSSSLTNKGTFTVGGNLEVHSDAVVSGTISVEDSGRVYDFGSTSPSAKYTLAVGGEVYAQAADLTVQDTAGNTVSADDSEAPYTDYDSTATAGLDEFSYKYALSTHTVTIKVTDGTDPISGATVVLNDGDTDYRATDNNDGRYTVANVPNGTYTISVTNATGYQDNTADSVTVSNADAEATVTLTKESTTTTYTVTIKVTDGTDPISGATVTLTDSTNTYSATESTTTSGTYTVENVPAGTYTVTVSATGYTQDSTPVTVEVGDTTSGVTNTATVTMTEDTTTPTAPTLDGLTVSAGTLTPTFDAGTTAYTVTVPNTTSSIAVTPTATSREITVNGTSVSSGAASGQISLNVGTNTITVVVTDPADPSSSTTYTITVNRESATITPPGGGGGGGGLPTTYPVNAPAVDNANVAVNPSPAQPGQTVTITVTPDEGYETDSVTVIGPGNVEVPVTDNGDGTYTFVMPNGGVTVDATVAPIQQPVFPFVDVPTDAYYRQAVEYMYELGLIQGTSETTFGPMLASTRGQVVAILYRLEGSPAVNGSNPFVDATADWVQAAVLWASQNGIVEGYNDTAFGPDDAITREQLAAILYRYASYKSYDLTVTGDLSIFNDASDVATWSHTPLAWAVGKGLIQGSNDLVNPQGSAIRAQLALVLMRFLENVAV